MAATLPAYTVTSGGIKPRLPRSVDAAQPRACRSQGDSLENKTRHLVATGRQLCCVSNRWSLRTKTSGSRSLGWQQPLSADTETLPPTR